MRLIYLFCVLYYYIFIFYCDVEFDKIARSVQTKIQAKIFGYRNFESKGTNKGCCGVKNENICLPCQYKVELISYQNPYSHHSKDKKITTLLGQFKTAGAELYENFENSLLFNGNIYINHNLEITSLQYPSSPQDTYPQLPSAAFTTFKYDGSYGVNNIIELWGEISIGKHSKNMDFYTATFRIDSIIWLNFKDKYGDCCSDKKSTYCDFECGFKFVWTQDDESFSTSEDINALNNNTHVNIGITLISYYSNDKYKINYELLISSSETENDIDKITFKNLENIPNIEYKKINVFGVYGNVVFNVSWMNNCRAIKGINCQNDCNMDGIIKSCGLRSQDPICLNGALDIEACENLPKDCNKNPCQNNSTCFINDEKLYCSCNPGYYGKLCENWQCDSQCNGNGECVGPNQCKCHPQYNGKDCESYPCNAEDSKMCDIGICVIISGVKKCKCTNKLVTGKNCSEGICTPGCVFGECKFIKKLGISRCICNELYEGEVCDLVKKTLNSKNYFLSFVLPIVFLALCIIAVVCFFLIYKHVMNGKSKIFYVPSQI